MLTVTDIFAILKKMPVWEDNLFIQDAYKPHNNLNSWVKFGSMPDNLKLFKINLKCPRFLFELVSGKLIANLS